MGSYAYFIHFIRRFQDSNNDCFVILSGGKGTGKSTIAMQISMEYIRKFGFICPHCGNEFYKNLYKMEKEGNTYKFYIPIEIKNDSVDIECPIHYELNLHTGQKEKVSGCGKTFKWSERRKIKWDADKFIAYTNQDCYNKLLKQSIYSPLISDEAINYMGSQDHNKVESKEMKKLVTVIRPKRRLIFAIIPNIKHIDSKYREEYSHFWIHCLDRGNAVIFEKDKGITADAWHLKEVEKSMGNVRFFTSLDKIKRKLRKIPTYFDSFQFSELPEKIYDQYELVRNAYNLQKQIEEQEISTHDLAKIMSFNLMNDWDRVYLEVKKAKGNNMTYSILRNEILKDPHTQKTLASETTIRNWIRGVEEYVKSKGKNISWVENVTLAK